jgi:indolepyruvate ferredoxin oxidoreductase alpha subunit
MPTRSGRAQVPLYILNVTYPLIPEEIVKFCAGKRAVLVVEEGQPEFIEQALCRILHQRDAGTRIVGKELLPMAGEYTGDVLKKGLAEFLGRWAPRDLKTPAATHFCRASRNCARAHGQTWRALVPQRPSGLCIGCPERPLVLRDQARAARVGRAAYQLRYRLPFFCDAAAV